MKRTISGKREKIAKDVAVSKESEKRRGRKGRKKLCVNLMYQISRGRRRKKVERARRRMKKEEM